MSNTAHHDWADSMADWACNQNCNQGRTCDCQPQPAEACTEVGADQPLTRKESATFWAIASAPAIVLIGVAGFFIWARFGHVW